MFADEAVLVGAQPADAGDGIRPRGHVLAAEGQRPLAVRLPALEGKHDRGRDLGGASQHHRRARAGPAQEQVATDARFAAYLAVMALLIFTPGPDTALVIRNALGSGARAATATAFGIGLGSVAWAVASLLGVAVILETSATAFTVLKLAGAAYLVYLGIRTLLGHGRQAKPSAQPMLDDRTAFQQGLLGNLLNPKAAAIFVTVFPQFI